MALPEKEKGVYLLPKSLDKQIDIALNHIDYESWFSDHMAKGYVGMFPVRLSMCKTEDERESVMLEAEIIVALYAVLVYYRYNEKEDFRKAIDSNSELSENFTAIKAWLDERGGKAIADELIELVKKEVVSQMNGGVG